MTEEQKEYPTYAEFWPFYLSQHSQRTTRLMHAIGTLLALLFILKGFLSFNPTWLVFAPVVGYGIPWIGHAFIEKNQPATFTYPIWSLRADFQMLWLWMTRRLDAELTKYNISV